MQVAATDGGCEVETETAAHDDKESQSDRACRKRIRQVRQLLSIRFPPEYHAPMQPKWSTVRARSSKHAEEWRRPHHDRAILFGQFAQAGQRANVAVHGEDAVGNEQPAARLIFYAGKLLFGMRQVFVIEHQNFGPREPRAVDDRSMIQLVGNNEILFAEDGRDRAGVGRESGLKDDARFNALKRAIFSSSSM